MQGKKILGVLLGGLLLSTTVEASYVFSNVSYTENSLTFTIDGDMTGYAPPQEVQYVDQFGFLLLGDLFSGPSSFTENNWSAPVFDNESLDTNGNLYAESPPVYLWSAYTNSLADSFATQNAVTVSWSQNWLTRIAHRRNRNRPLFVA